jgi:hypothetical protein
VREHISPLLIRHAPVGHLREDAGSEIVIKHVNSGDAGSAAVAPSQDGP